MSDDDDGVIHCCGWGPGVDDDDDDDDDNKHYKSSLWHEIFEKIQLCDRRIYRKWKNEKSMKSGLKEFKYEEHRFTEETSPKDTGYLYKIYKKSDGKWNGVFYYKPDE